MDGQGGGCNKKRQMEYTKIFIGVWAGSNKWKWLKWVAFFRKNWYCPSSAIRLHRATSKNADHKFAELSIYI